MNWRLLPATIAVVATGVGAGVAHADPGERHEVAGQPFYFVGTCTGVGDVLLVNQSLARGVALLIVSGDGGVVHQGTPGVEGHANAECTLTGGGFSPEAIEPFDEPFSFPAFIAGA